VSFIFIYGIGVIGYILGAIIVILQFIPHRGIMHTTFMGLLLSAMIYFCFNNWVFAAVALLNFISHLILDKW